MATRPYDLAWLNGRGEYRGESAKTLTAARRSAKRIACDEPRGIRTPIRIRGNGADERWTCLVKTTKRAARLSGIKQGR